MEMEFAPAPDRRQIILMVSQTCNLSCMYCYQTHKAPGLMSADVARRILEEEFARMSADGPTKRAEIAYMGGEPLLNFELIRELSEWLWSSKLPVPCEITIRTNGTLLTRDMERWLSVNRSRIDVGLSMDGLSTMNRLNRTGSTINWNFFRENWPARRVKVVLFRDSINLLAEAVREMNRTDVAFEAVIGEGFEWSPEAAGLLESELTDLIPDYLDRPDEAVNCGLFSFRIADFFPEYPIRNAPFCGDANNIIAYDADGSPCICHLFSTPVLGREKARWAWATLKGIASVPFDPRCTACPIQKNCRNCFGENLRLCGTVYRSASRTTICNAMKAKARACSLLFIGRIERRIASGEHLSCDDQQNAERALRVLETTPPFTES
jgi:organic radical activating enzyme